MRQGGGKQKGGRYEREISVALSQWITGGARDDVFWRSAMSGGRATVRGTDVRQAGDICAVAPEGHVLCDRYFIECKCVSKLGLDQAIIKGTGPLMNYWRKAENQATLHNKKPILIAKQNGWPSLIIHHNDFGLKPYVEVEFCVNFLNDLLATPVKKALR